MAGRHLSLLPAFGHLSPKLRTPHLHRFSQAPAISFVTLRRTLTSQAPNESETKQDASSISTSSSFHRASAPSQVSSKSKIQNPAPDWEENPNYTISRFSELPHTDFGVNQHMLINDEFKEALRQILWQFRAPIRYAFAYGSGVFPQSEATVAKASDVASIHPKPDPAVTASQGGHPKMIDFIFGVSFTQHWHALNLQQHRNHYSALGYLGSAAVSTVQDRWGAGVYFNPYITVNGTLVKYGVVNIDTLCTDLSEWTTLYLAGRLHKPVKILRDEPRVRLANQVNLISALRTALLLLPPSFTEQELYATIANISYMGDPRMSLPSEDPSKVANIVGHNLPNFRRLYGPLISNLPNVRFNDPQCSDPDWTSNPTSNLRLVQDMDPVRRGNMVRRLPKSFRSKIYFHYQSKYQIPQLEFEEMMKSSSDEDRGQINRREGGGFDRRIAQENPEELRTEVLGVIKKTIGWPSWSQTLKGPVTAGWRKSWRYTREKMDKYREGKRRLREALEERDKKD